MEKVLIKDEILRLISKKQKIKTKDIVSLFGVSRQHASLLARELVGEGKLVKIGSTRNTFYVTPEFTSKHADELPTRFKKRFDNKSLEEHLVLAEVKKELIPVSKLKENVRSIFEFAFLEMLNNAIEHSQTKYIDVEVIIENQKLILYIYDFGIGVFRNIMKKRKLKSELEAIQDLLKGKTTTAPKFHSGEGIFFTSKMADEFVLDSFGQKLIIDNQIKDIFLGRPKTVKKGTKVKFSIATNSELHLNEFFKKYTNIDDESDYGFDRTEIKIKLYTVGGIYVSRSQARRLLVGLDKFKSIILDFDQVPMVGQAFADEVFRVFYNKFPKIEIKPVNMNEGVKFMIERVEKDSK